MIKHLEDKIKLNRLLNLGTDLNRIHDPDALMERILKEARDFCSADAGSIYIAEKNHLLISYIQNDTLSENKVVYKEHHVPIDNFSIAGYCAKTGEIVLLNDVSDIGSDLPFKFNSDFDEMTGYKTKSILSIPMKGSLDRVIGVLQIINPLKNNTVSGIFTEEDTKTLLHFAGIAAVALQKAQLTKSIILKMIQMAELHDPSETGAHVHRVSAYSTELYIAWAVKNNISPEEIDRNKDILKLVAMVHDIGKVAISDLILKKPGKLTDEEYEIMKKHTVFGAKMFEEEHSEFDQAAREVILNHHERWDGNGYPGLCPAPDYESDKKTQGKKGKEIPLFGRIVSIADVFDALSSKRCYKDPWPHEKVIDFLKENSGKMFDPELIEIFIDNIDIMNSISQKFR
ncbi:MAG: HD domain-containing protein [Desulfobacteraceae bacterium]|nr:HD domain-containing protein [Desulfobacteraceae bacterium]MCB9494524.1 HD domain-containing protein [Desulfobacteraceae bacterium]